MPRQVQALVLAVIAAGAAVVVACAAGYAGEPVDAGRLRRGARGAASSLAELFPIRLPGGAEETSFSTSFAFALLVTHGVEVDRAGLRRLPAGGRCDPAARRRSRSLYNAGQYAISWAARRARLRARWPDRRAALDEAGLVEFAALLPAAARVRRS